MDSVIVGRQIKASLVERQWGGFDSTFKMHFDTEDQMYQYIDEQRGTVEVESWEWVDKWAFK